MLTFGMAETRSFAADLFRQMDECDNGEGMQCASLDAALVRYARLCCEFSEAVRTWGRGVFSGRAAFDPEVDALWREEGIRLYNRALMTHWTALHAQEPCYSLDGQSCLRVALQDLHWLLANWVTPRLAVAPAVRRQQPLPDEVVQEARRRLESLPPLPADWQPDSATQQAVYRKLRSS